MVQPNLNSIHPSIRWMALRPGDQSISVETGELISVVVEKDGKNLECHSADYSDFCINECSYTDCVIKKRLLERG